MEVTRSCAPDHYSAGMAKKIRGSGGRTPSAVGPLPGGLRPPLQSCSAGLGQRVPQNGAGTEVSCPGQGDKSRGKGIPQDFCHHRHRAFTSQEAGERFGWLSTAGAAKEGERGDAEGNR